MEMALEHGKYLLVTELMALPVKQKA